MLIDKARIRTMIPHAGAMCLLDSVETWDAASVVCRTASHRDVDNPLRQGARLAAVHAFEYGGQAAAVHGALLAAARGGRASFAWLGAIRGGALHVARLDDLDADLRVRAELLAADARSALYACRLDAGSTAVAEARLTIVFRDGDA